VESAALGELLTTLLDDDKVIAAVCHGPAALLSAVRDDGSWAFAGRSLSAFTNDEETQAGLADRASWLLEDRLRQGRSAYVPRSLTYSMCRVPSPVKGCSNASVVPSNSSAGNSEPRAERRVERRRRLAPCTADMHLRIAVKHKDIRSHYLCESLRLEVIAHVGETEPGGNAERSRGRGEYDRLRDAVRRAALDHGTRDVVTRIPGSAVRVVADLVTYGGK